MSTPPARQGVWRYILSSDMQPFIKALKDLALLAVIAFTLGFCFMCGVVVAIAVIV